MGPVHRLARVSSFVVAILSTITVSVLAVSSQARAAECKIGVFYDSKNPTVEVARLKPAKPFSSSAKVECRIVGDIREKENHRFYIETGTSEGIKYQLFYSDGSGSVQGLERNTLKAGDERYETNWHTSCAIDAIDDTHYCVIDREDLRIALDNSGRYYVLIGHDHYPGSQIALRIDGNKPFRASARSGFAADQVREILRQMQTGSIVVTRYREWPYDSDKDKQHELFGVSVGLSILDWLVANVKP